MSRPSASQHTPSTWHFRELDRVSAALARPADVESTIENVIAAVLDIFDADRAWLLSPCDPGASAFSVPVEVAKPAYPGPGAARRHIAMSPGMAAIMRAALATTDPLTGPGEDPESGPFESARRYGVKSRMWMAVNPRDETPWMLGLHQCSYEREWTGEEQALFREIGLRIADALTIRLLLQRLERDIEQRSLAERALAESEGRFRDFAEAGADWFWETDCEGRYTYVSGNFSGPWRAGSRALLGRTRAEFHADNELMTKDDWVPLEATIRAQEPFLDFRVRMRDRETDRIRVQALNGRPRFDALGNFNGYRGTGREITELVEAEQRERRLEEQLRHNQKLQAIGQLTGGIAHDFNNILSSVLGYTELAMALPSGDPDRKLPVYLREIQSASARARDLVGQMLTFSRGGDSPPSPTDAAQVVAGAVRMLSSTLPATVGIKVSEAPNIRPALIDPVHLMQITLNLCINARDALEGSGTILIGLHHTTGHGICTGCQMPVNETFAELRVQDDGCGMDGSIIARIFDPFFSTKRDRNGTGMGLSVVHGIVHDVGGHVQVESTPGQGSTIRVLLPLAAPGTRPVNVSSVALPHRRMTNSRHSGARILVVDDEPPITSFITEYLEGEGYRVTSTTDPRAAELLVRADPFSIDAVISDQTMPGLTGDQLLRTMLALRPDLPFILCSGYSESVDETRAATIGARAFLRKPISGETLVRHVEAALAG